MDGKVASLLATRLFDGWTSPELRRLAKVADVVDLMPSETLVRTGAWHAGCYLITSGALVTTAPDGSRLIATVGEFVGLAETLAGVAALGESVALRAATVLAFTTTGFVSALEGLRPLRQFALTQLAVAQVAPRRGAPTLSLALAH